MNKIKDFWEMNYEYSNTDMKQNGMNCEYWLSNQPFKEIHQLLDTTFKIDMKVLVIGIGSGNDIKQLKNITDNIYAADISQKAIDKMEGIIIEGYTPENYDKIPQDYFDLIISHLVSQHMNNEDLNYQIKMMMPCLNKTGVFAMQFASAKDGNNMDEKPVNDEMQMCGAIGRSPEFMKSIFDKYGKFVWLSEPLSFEGINTLWYAIKYRR